MILDLPRFEQQCCSVCGVIFEHIKGRPRLSCDKCDKKFEARIDVENWRIPARANNTIGITINYDFPIQPEMIDASDHFFDAFDNYETEISAHYIVLLCQEQGSWKPFTKADINKIARHTFVFNRLVSCGFVACREDKYYVTDSFVNNCFKSRPVLPPPQDRRNDDKV